MIDKQTQPGRKEDRKAMQLCRQVEQTLSYVLHGDSDDELLQSLQVVSVAPAPDASRLLVTVVSDLPAEQFDLGEILKCLDGETPRLRCEVATSINRKKTPSLAFNVIGQPAAK